MNRSIHYSKNAQHLKDWLTNPASPSVLSKEALFLAFNEHAPQTETYHQFKSAIRWLEKTHALRKVRNNIFLNTSKKPSGRLDDLVSYANTKAIVSLHSSLGSSGVHHNPSIMSFGVYPASIDKAGREHSDTPTRIGHLKLYALPEHFFDQDQDYSWISEGHRHARFIPEKALLDWIWLGNHQDSSLPEPNPCDIDLDKLDLNKVGFFAHKLAMDDSFTSWLSRHPSPNEQAQEIIGKHKKTYPEPLPINIHHKRIHQTMTLREKARARGLAR